MNELTAKDIEKYKDKSLNALIALADRYFNKFICLRDISKGYGCISCDTGKIEHACHLYSAGNYKNLRYNESNVNGGCNRCNTHLAGNLLEYRTRLRKRIGEELILQLETLAAINKNHGFKWDRLSLYQTIIHYREKCKTL